LTAVLFTVGFSLSPKEVTFEKTLSYDCGFEPFGDVHLIHNFLWWVPHPSHYLHRVVKKIGFTVLEIVKRISSFVVIVMFYFVFRKKEKW
jgi:NADH:ubiquinone oxidoreductase subunit 3 (subunit A)